MSASKIFGALLWSIGAAIIVIYSSWVALQLVSILWQDSISSYGAKSHHDEITITD